MATTPIQHPTIFNISLKPEIAEPQTWDNAFGCPLCFFKGKDSGELKKHYQSQEHQKAYFTAMKSPDPKSSFYEKHTDETEKEYLRRVNFGFTVGILPSYISVVEKYGAYWFSHAFPKKSEMSLSSREKRGEVGLLSPQQFAHMYGKLSGHSIFQVYETNKFSRSYGSYPSFQNFWEESEKTPEDKKFFNEQFLEDYPCREIFDIDSTNFSKEEADFLNIPQLFIKLRKEFSPNEKLKFFITEACGEEKGKYKISYHVVTNKVHCDIVEMGKFMKDFIPFLQRTKEGSVLADIIDKQIYTKNRSIRSMKSIKYEGKRRLLPIKEHETLDPINFFASQDAHLWLGECKEEEEEKEKEMVFSQNSEDHEDILISFVQEKLEGVFEVQKEGNRWRLQRMRNETNMCPFCDREHEGDNYRAYVRSGRLWVHCFRSGKSVAITKPKKGAKMLPHKAEKIVPLLKADFCYDSPFCRPMFFQKDKKCFAIRSAMGTGKTKALAEYLKFHPHERVLSVTYRRSLARETSNNLPGFVNYEDLGSGWLQAKRLSVQIDSLHRVFGKYDLLVCDEITYTLSRLLCDVSEKDNCWGTFQQYIKKTPKILLMDKNLDQGTIDMFEELGASCYVSRNEHKAHTNKKLFVSPTFLEFKERLLDELANGKKICFPCSSKKKLLVVCKEAQELGYRVLWYTGDGASENAWLEQWDEYDMVAYTPTISAGVSYEQEHFDKVYGYFSSRSCCAEEAEQMLFRVRNIADNEIVLAFDNRSINCPTTIKDVTESIENKDGASFSLSGIEWDLHSGKMVDTPRSRAHVRVIVQRNLSRKNLRGILIGLLEEQGIHTNYLSTVLRGKELEAVREDSKFLEKKLKMYEAVSDCQSPSLTRQEFSFLCNYKEKTNEQISSCRKFMFAHNFELKQEELTPEFILEYQGKEKIFENQRLAFSGTKEEQKERLSQLLEIKNEQKRTELTPDERIGVSHHLEKVVYARRLFYWLGYGSTTSREKKNKEEMASRILKIRERVKRSRHFQELLGKLPDEEEHTVRWINNILRKMFDCYIARTSRRKDSTKWELAFSSVWKHGETTTHTPKRKTHTLVPEVF
ncbi:replication [Noumeavirus]|uniref:replication n=1 Tax=Noumeavirus TaxID=1955558 RepID=UPI000982F1CF|nr:replication [Noumeavirus]AQM73416.1 origin of replication-binding protein [Noumeavirus]